MSNDIYGKFYSPVRLLSCGKPLSISVGVRSAGKSTGTLIHVLKEYMKYGRRFIYIRTTKDEIDRTAPNAFDASVDIYNDYYEGSSEYKHIDSFEYKGGDYYINGENAGIAIPLSMQAKYKSRSDLQDVFWMIWDEFLPDVDSGGQILGGKDNPDKAYNALMSLFVSVDRGKGRAFRNECRMVLLGNNKTYCSPIFMKLGIDKLLKFDTKLLNGKALPYALEQTHYVDALDEAKTSNAYLLSDSYNRKYAFEGGVDDNTFIGKPDVKTAPLINIKFNNDTFGVYFADSLIYVSSVPCRGTKTLALTGADHSPDYELVKEWHCSMYMTKLRDAIKEGNILFENQRCRYGILTFYRYDQ